MSLIFQPTVFQQPIIRVSAADPWPSALNAGLIGRWETNTAASWPGSGDTFTNLATASRFSGHYAKAFNYADISATGGVNFTGTGTNQGVQFGITGSEASGSYTLNSAIIGDTNAVTVAYVANVTNTSAGDVVLMTSWTDFSDQNFHLVDRTTTTAVRTNNSFNVASLSSIVVTGTDKFYGTRLAFGTNGHRLWRATSNYSTQTLSGTTFGGTEEKGKRSAWIFGTNANAGASWAMNRCNFRGRWYASYMWNRILSDQEMLDVQSYTNTYIKANS